MRLGFMRILKTVAMGVLAAGALYGLFIAFCILPKVEQAEIDLHTKPPDWISVPVSLTGYWMLDTIYVFSTVLIITLIITLLPFIPDFARRLAAGTTYTLAWASSAFAVYFLTIAAAGMIYANMDLMNRSHIYAITLEHFALLESANKKFDEVQAFTAKLGSMRMVEVKDTKLLTREDRSERIRAILLGLKETQNIALLKQMLATSDEFRDDIVKDSLRTKPILDAAARCGAPATDINAFYDWLEPKIGSEGWERLPIFVPVFNQ
jgi:hypothetical protein